MYGMSAYIFHGYVRRARLGTWKHIHELEWACELECRACLSDAVKAYAGHQTAPVVVNFVTTWLPVVAARLFMWSEGSFARERNVLNAATVWKVNNFTVETTAWLRSKCILFKENVSTMTKWYIRAEKYKDLVVYSFYGRTLRAQLFM